MIACLAISRNSLSREFSFGVASLPLSTISQDRGEEDSIVEIFFRRRLRFLVCLLGNIRHLLCLKTSVSESPKCQRAALRLSWIKQQTDFSDKAFPSGQVV